MRYWKDFGECNWGNESSVCKSFSLNESTLSYSFPSPFRLLPIVFNILSFLSNSFHLISFLYYKYLSIREDILFRKQKYLDCCPSKGEEMQIIEFVFVYWTSFHEKFWFSFCTFKKEELNHFHRILF